MKIFKAPIFWILLLGVGYTAYRFRDGFTFQTLTPSAPVSQSQEVSAQERPEASAEVPSQSPRQTEALETESRLKAASEKLGRLLAGRDGTKKTVVESNDVSLQSSHVTYRFRNRIVPDQEAMQKLHDDVFVDLATNTVVAWDAPQTFVKTLGVLDRSPRSLVLETVVMFARLQAGETLGVEWVFDPSLGFKRGVRGRGGSEGYSLGYQTDVLSAALNASVTAGRAVVESRPHLQVLTGEVATVASGREVAVPVSSSNNVQTRTSVEFKEALLSLEVTVIPMEGKKMRVAITHTNNEVGSVRVIDGNEIPELQVSTVQTSVEVLEGLWYPVGGVKVVSEEAARTGAKFLSGLPGIGRLFRVHNEDLGRVESMLWFRVAGEPSGIRTPVLEKPASVERSGTAQLPRFRFKRRSR